MENQGIKTSTIVWIVIGIIVVIGGTWAWVHYKNKPEPTASTTGEVSPAETMRIDAKHQFKNGTHVIAGEVNLPTPCYLISTSPSVASGTPDKVTIAFTASTTGEACAEQVTTERFKTSFMASQDAVISATWNGQPAILNLIPAGENEDLNNFEIYTKG